MRGTPHVQPGTSRPLDIRGPGWRSAGCSAACPAPGGAPLITASTSRRVAWRTAFGRGWPAGGCGGGAGRLPAPGDLAAMAGRTLAPVIPLRALGIVFSPVAGNDPNQARLARRDPHLPETPRGGRSGVGRSTPRTRWWWRTEPPRCASAAGGHRRSDSGKQIVSDKEKLGWAPTPRRRGALRGPPSAATTSRSSTPTAGTADRLRRPTGPPRRAAGGAGLPLARLADPLRPVHATFAHRRGR